MDLSANLRNELYSRSIDMAFQNGPFERETSGQETLGTYRWIWVAAPELPGLDGDDVSEEKLLRYPILTHARDTRPFEEVAGHFRSLRGATTARLVPSSNLAACLHMCIDAMGIASMPASMARDYINTGQLRQVHYPWAPESLVFLARYDAARSPAFVSRAALLARDVARQYVERFDETWDAR